MTRYVDEYRDAGLCAEISAKIKDISRKPFNIMEVCGGHTMSIRKNGIHKMVGNNIRLMSGPGCPVCVAAVSDVDKAAAVSLTDNTVLCTFGDMMRVPGSKMSLITARALGGDVRTVYSVQDALKYAKAEPDKMFVFLAAGFETTAPTIAAAIIQAGSEDVRNFSVLSLLRTMPRALEAVLSGKPARIDALLCPGHVTVVTGTEMYRTIVAKRGVSCCVSGFEPADILRAIYELTKMHEASEPGLFNAYERVVEENGNLSAKRAIDEVFEPASTSWRGLGVIPLSGLKIKEKYSDYDAEKRLDIKVQESAEKPGCICGDILRGARVPEDCGLFGKTCTPEDPMGACMVSSEGTCAAWYQYGK
ncbi:MAG: hydrogenase formation protein HypD [Candidatus Omnitrophota bacterium]|nr:hydrogenase formation protein HypD [Candidatus Omnitrophota bacterium]